MRRLVIDDTAETRLFLFGLIQALTRESLPKHAPTVLFYLAAYQDSVVTYEGAQAACDLSDGQMATAVKALFEAGWLHRGHVEDDQRRFTLSLSKKGLTAFGTLLKQAQVPVDRKI